MRLTKPASRNELRKGATTTAARTKTPALFKLSKRSGPSIDRRMRKAPRSASHELLTKKRQRHDDRHAARQLHQEVRGERAQENDPPLPRRQQEQRGEQDRIRRP